MLHGADERVKEHLLSDMTMTTEVEEAAQSSAHVDIEIHANHVKGEPGLVQFVKSEAALSVKEEILEDSRQDETMLHGADERVKDITMKIEVKEALQSSAQVEIEIHTNHIKEEPGLVQFVKSEAALSVKEEILEDSRQDDNEQQRVQGTPIPAGTRSVNEACSTKLGDLNKIKHEPSDIDVGPTVVQHMDTHYTINKAELNGIKQENTIHSLDAEEVLSRIKDGQVRNETTEDSQKDGNMLSDKEEDYTKTDLKSSLGHQKDKQRCHMCQYHLPSSNRFKCDTCHRTFHNPHLLEKKLHQQENSKTSVKTNSQDGMVKAKQNPFRVQTDEMLPGYQGDTCNTRFADKNALTRHMRVYKGERSFVCIECGSKFSGRSALTIHMRVHTGEKLFVCSDCGAKFTQNITLTVHMRGHTGEKPFVCSECGSKFRHNSALTVHMRGHTGEKPFVCNECGAKFKESGALTNHIRVHTGEKRFVCSECGAKFARSSTLTVHMRGHTGEKPFMCSECGTKFARSSDLTVHSRVHTREKPFVCSECSAKFARSSALTRHMRGHTGEKPFVCSECGAKYKESGNLTIHMRGHTGEKPFVCSECGAKFTRSSALTIHMKVHMGKQQHD